MLVTASCDVHSIRLLAQRTPCLCQFHFMVAASDTDTVMGIMGLCEVSAQKSLQIVALLMRKFCSITGCWDLLGILFLCWWSISWDFFAVTHWQHILYKDVQTAEICEG